MTSQNLYRALYTSLSAAKKPQRQNIAGKPSAAAVPK